MVMIKFGLTIFCGIKFCQFFQIYVETLEWKMKVLQRQLRRQ
jgi:hypothetical protein